MNERTRTFLSRLLDAPGPSGYEIAAARVWRAEAEEFATEVWSDVYGNSFAAIGEEDGPGVMLAGHIDEIGLMVHHIDDEGYLYVKAVGGWDPQVLVGQRVEILTADGPLLGVVGRRAIHLIDRKDRDKAVDLKDLWIDIGASDGDEAREEVEVGDVAIVRSDTVELGDGRVAARSIDDRIGAVVVLEALRRAWEEGCEARAVAVGTTQEEISYKSGGGARTGTFGLDPQAAVVVDVTHATDHPSVDQTEHGDVTLGGGPVLSRGAVVNPVMFRRLMDAAEAEDVEVQRLASPSSSGTDADSIYTSRSGVATAIVSIPNRYMHSPNQVIDGEDVERAIRLIARFLVDLTPDVDFRPGR
jgi:endoglucanase